MSGLQTKSAAPVENIYAIFPGKPRLQNAQDVGKEPRRDARPASLIYRCSSCIALRYSKGGFAVQGAERIKECLGQPISVSR